MAAGSFSLAGCAFFLTEQVHDWVHQGTMQDPIPLPPGKAAPGGPDCTVRWQDGGKTVSCTEAASPVHLAFYQAPETVADIRSERELAFHFRQAGSCDECGNLVLVSPVPLSAAEIGERGPPSTARVFFFRPVKPGVEVLEFRRKEGRFRRSMLVRRRPSWWRRGVGFCLYPVAVAGDATALTLVGTGWVVVETAPIWLQLAACYADCRYGGGGGCGYSGRDSRPRGGPSSDRR